jgi:hypothetical protein
MDLVDVCDGESDTDDHVMPLVVKQYQDGMQTYEDK